MRCPSQNLGIHITWDVLVWKHYPQTNLKHRKCFLLMGLGGRWGPCGGNTSCLALPPSTLGAIYLSEHRTGTASQAYPPCSNPFIVSWTRLGYMFICQVLGPQHPGHKEEWVLELSRRSWFQIHTTTNFWETTPELRCGSVMESLPAMQKALGSIPSTIRKILRFYSWC
jgi:hypothetical protein